MSNATHQKTEGTGVTLFSVRAWLDCALVLILAGCSHAAVERGPDLMPLAKSVLERAGSYSADVAPQAFEQSREQWLLNGHATDILLNVPRIDQAVPLILYFPGLGESAAAGRWWRDYWAERGYAVLSLQERASADALSQLPQSGRDKHSDEAERAPDCRTLQDDEVSRFSWMGQTCRPSTEAVDSELRYLGNQFFSALALKQRLQNLREAYAQIKQRKASGDPRFARIDLQRVIVAGYELGAQTVTTLLGESVAGLENFDPGFKPIAGIVISPMIDVASGNPKQRFRAIQNPMLVVTGTLDEDPYALTTAAARSALWDYASGTQQYSLLLNQADHALLAGGEYVLRVRNRPLDLDSQYDERFLTARSARRLEPEQRDAQHVAAMQAITTAFLDRAVKQSRVAQIWLDSQAELWLGSNARLRNR